jgi:hypothetical protein
MKPGHGIPLDRFLLLPLDITTPHELPFPIYRTYVDTAFESTAMPSHSEGKPPLRHFTSSFFERTREIMLEFGKDAMEVCSLLYHPMFCSTPSSSMIQLPSGVLLPTLCRSTRKMPNHSSAMDGVPCDVSLTSSGGLDISLNSS